MGGGLIIDANIPVQELEGQRGEGAYFREDTVLPRVGPPLPQQYYIHVCLFRGGGGGGGEQHPVTSVCILNTTQCNDLVSL